MISFPLPSLVGLNLNQYQNKKETTRNNSDNKIYYRIAIYYLSIFIYEIVKAGLV